MNKKIIVIAVVALLVLVLGFFLRTNSVKTTPTTNLNSSLPKIQVTTSFYPLYFFASLIGGGKVDVANITPSGSEPHDYEPTAQDIARIEKSNLLILNGGVEAWGDKIKDNLKGTNVQIVTAGEGLLTRQLSEEGAVSPDPHVWLSPKLAKIEVGRIEQALEKVDPNNASFYQANAKNLDDKLDALDANYKQGLANCQSKDIITSHAAFGYLGSDYGLNQVPIAGLSPDEEPSPKQLADVANFAKANRMKYIFFESLVSPKLSETVATEIGAQTLVLDPLEGISDDDMKAGKDYFTVMADNLKNLQVALGCTTTQKL